MPTFADGVRIDVRSQFCRDMVAAALVNSPILQRISEYNAFFKDAMDYDYRVMDGTAKLQSRVRGNGLPENERLTPPLPIARSQSIYGDKFVIDKADIRDIEDKNRRLEHFFSKAFKKKRKAFWKLYDKELIHGDGTGGRLRGLFKIFNGKTNLPSLNGTGVIDASSCSPDELATYLDLTYEGNDEAVLEFLEKTLAKMPDSKEVWCNGDLRVRLATIAHRNNKTISTSETSFGRPVTEMFGKKFVQMQNTTFTNDEPDNSDTPVNQTSSLFIPNLGIENGLTFVTNATLDGEIYDPDDTESEGHKWETRGDWMIDESEGGLRINNICVIKKAA